MPSRGPPCRQRGEQLGEVRRDIVRSESGHGRARRVPQDLRAGFGAAPHLVGQPGRGGDEGVAVRTRHANAGLALAEVFARLS